MNQQTPGEPQLWNDLSTDCQTNIQIEYGYYLDSLPPTCSMDSKIERFQRWLLEEKNILYPGPND